MRLTPRLIQALGGAGSQYRERPSRTTVSRADKGLFLDRPAADIPEGGLQDCLNIKIKDSEITNRGIGWTRLMAKAFTTSGDTTLTPGVYATAVRRCLSIAAFTSSLGVETTLFGTTRDWLQYDQGSNTASYITPRYETGTLLTVSGFGVTTVGGSGTLWDTTATGQPRPNVESGGVYPLAGDYISFGASGRTAIDPPTPWYQIASVASDTYMVVALIAESDYSAGTSYTIRRAFTGGNDDLWNDAMFLHAQPDGGDRWFATNGISVVKWDGTADQCEYIDLGFVPKQIIKHKNIMIYGDLTYGGASYPQSIRTSDIAKPESVTNGNATELAVTDKPNQMMSLEGLGDFVVIYFDKFVQMLEFVGPPGMWRISTAVADIGCVAPRGVTTFSNIHWFISDDGAYQFDGQQTTRLAEHVFAPVMQGTFDVFRAKQSIMHVDPFHGEVHFILPLASDALTETSEAIPERSYTVHYSEPSRGMPTPTVLRDLPASAVGSYSRTGSLTFDDVTDGFNTISFQWNDRYFAKSARVSIFADNLGYINTLNIGSNQNGVSLYSYATFGRVLVVGERSSGMMQRVEPFVTAEPSSASPLEINIYTSSWRDALPDRLYATSFSQTGTGSRYVPTRAWGRYTDLLFWTSGDDEYWSISGYSFEATPAGTR